MAGLSLFLLWIVIGYIAFLIEARQTKATKLGQGDCDLVELTFCICFGIFSLIVIIARYVIRSNPFKRFVEWTMRIVNR